MNASLRHYPVQWIDRWELASGQRVTVRPVLPQDHLLERAFVARGMTARSRYQRFQIGLRELSDSVAHYLTEVHYERHFALVVEHFGPSGHAQIADARFVRDPRQRGASEFALAVADDWQGLGLGRRLVETLLAAARDQGQQTLYGDVLRDNQQMLSLAHTMGFARHRRRAPGAGSPRAGGRAHAPHSAAYTASSSRARRGSTPSSKPSSRLVT